MGTKDVDNSDMEYLYFIPLSLFLFFIFLFIVCNDPAFTKTAVMFVR